MQSNNYNFVYTNTQHNIQKNTQKNVLFYTQYQKKSLQVLSSSNHALAEELKRLAERNPFVHVKWNIDVNEIALDQASSPSTILDDLRYQLATLNQKHDPRICEYIIETLDDHGFLSYPISEYCEQLHISEETFHNQLAIIQTFEPFGIACKNSIDFIIKQLQKKQDHLSIEILTNHDTQIIRKEFNAIGHSLQVTEQEVINAIQRIRKCDLYPCEINNINSNNNAISKSISINDNNKNTINNPNTNISKTQNNKNNKYITNDYIIPDIIVKVTDIGLYIEPFQFAQVETTPYMEELNNAMKEYFKESKLFIDAFHHRNQTLLRVANELFKRQELHFLNNEPLLSCTLADISEITELHISTVSRTLQGKYYDFQGQLKPLKTLLTNRSISNKSEFEIKALLRHYISKEIKSYPYSDKELQEMFMKEGIQLSRRVISKYRKDMNIPNTYLRQTMLDH